MKIKLRPVMLELIEDLKAQGLNLGGDVASMTMTYPEHPEVVINLSIGGLLYDAVEPEYGAN